MIELHGTIKLSNLLSNFGVVIVLFWQFIACLKSKNNKFLNINYLHSQILKSVLW